MITKQQAIDLPLNEIHYYNPKTRIAGLPNSKKYLRCTKWRRNGKTKVWKTRPLEFSVPIKHGLYAYAHLTNKNAERYHLSTECNGENFK